MTAARPGPPPSTIGRVFEHRCLQLPADVPGARSSRRSCRRSCSWPRWASGSARTSPTADRARRRAVPRLPGARAARRDRDADRRRSRRRSRSWPGSSWNRIFHAMHATPISPRDIALGNLAWIAARLTLIATVFMIVIVAVRRGRVAADRAGDPGRGPDRPGVRRPDRRLLGDAEDARTGSPRSSASGSRRCSCSPARSSRSTRCRRSLQVARLAHAALPRRRADPGAVARDVARRCPVADARPRRVPVGLAIVGAWLTIRTIERRLVR